MWAKQGQPRGVGVQSGFCFRDPVSPSVQRSSESSCISSLKGKSQRRTSYALSLKHLIHSSWFQCFVPELYVLLNSSAAARFMLYIKTLSAEMTIVFSQCEQSAHSCFLFTFNLTNAICLCFTLCFHLIWFEVNVSHSSSSVNTPGFVCDCVNSGVLGQSLVSFSVMQHDKHNDPSANKQTWQTHPELRDTAADVAVLSLLQM